MNFLIRVLSQVTVIWWADDQRVLSVLGVAGGTPGHPHFTGAHDRHCFELNMGLRRSQAFGIISWRGWLSRSISSRCEHAGHRGSAPAPDHRAPASPLPHRAEPARHC